jgi:plastocyanin
MKLRALALASILPLGVLVIAGGASAEGPKLLGKVGPGFSISLTDASGNRVTQLDPGPYELEIDDQGLEHNFHFSGPGVDVTTEVEEVAKKTFQLTLQNGTYTFVCDPHRNQMRGSLTAGTPPAQPSPEPKPPTTTPKPSAAVGAKLALTVGPGFTIGLKTMAGKKVTNLKSGRYTIVARDRSNAHNAHILGAGVNRKTTVAGLGTQTWTVVLKKGTLTFRCDPHASTMRGSVKIA